MINEDHLYLLEDIFLSIIEILLILSVYSRIYTLSKPYSRKTYIKASCLMICVTIALKFILSEGRPTSLPPVTVLSSYFFLGLYNTSKQKKILFSFILFTISSIATVLCDIIITPLQLHYLAMIFLHTCFWILLYFIILAGRYKESEIPRSLWILLFIITLTCISVLCITEYYILQRENPYEVTIEIPIMCMLLLITLSILIIFDKFSTLIQEVKETALLKQQVKMQNEHYKELESVHNNLYSIQHDMKNHIRTAYQMAVYHGNNTELVNYLYSVSSELKKAEQIILSGNKNIDSILNIKLNELKQNNIKVKTEIHIPSHINITFEQSVTILGNLIDNALEACLKLPENSRWIYIQLQYINNMLYIKIENSSEEVKFNNNSLPKTTKKNEDMHGIGLKNVKNILKDAGTIDLKSTPQSFTISVILYDV